MIRIFLFIVSVSCFLCGTVFAEGIRGSAAEHAASVSFYDIKREITIASCKVVENAADACRLELVLKNSSTEDVLLDVYSHSGVEQVCPPQITRVRVADAACEEGEEEADSVTCAEVPDQLLIPAQGAYLFSLPLPMCVAEWLNEGDTAEFCYTIQYWKKGNVAVDGEGDVCTFTAEIGK